MSVTPSWTIGFDGFTQVEEQAKDAICRTFVTFNLAYPATGLGVGCECLFHAEPFSEPWRVLRRDKELWDRSGRCRTHKGPPAAGADSGRVRVRSCRNSSSASPAIPGRVGPRG